MTSREPWPGIALDRVVDTLGAPAVDLLAPTKRLVTSARIYDPLDPHIAAGELVLGVNLPAGDVADLVRRACAAEASGIAVKGDVPDDAVDAAADAGVGVLSVQPDVTWDQVFRVVQALTTAPDDADAEAPVRDLFSLANAIAALVGGAVTIEDPRSTLLAYSTLDQPIDEPRRATILGRNHGSGWSGRLAELGVLRPLVAAPGTVIPVVDPTGEARPRLAASVGAGGELLGFVWAVQGERAFTPADEEALRGALPLVALHILRHRASGDLTRRQRGAALRDALDGDVPASLAADLGIASEARCAIAAFRLLVEDEVELTVKRAKAVDLITTAAEAFRRRVVCAWIDATVYALFPEVDRVSSQQLLGLVQGIAQQAQAALAARVVAGIGSSVDGLAAVGVSRGEADRVVRVLATRADGLPAAHIDEVRTPATLLAVRDALRDRPEIRLPDVTRLEREDAEHGTQHTATLRAFALNGGSITATAKALSLHPNSVRYRIGRAQELLDVDLSSPDALLLVALHFHTT